MRLVFVIAALDCGGAQRVASLLCSAWARRGERVTILTFEDGRTPPFFPLEPTVEVVPLSLLAGSGGPGAAARNLGRVRALRRAIASRKSDAVVSFLDTTNVLTLLATRGLGVPVLVSERIDPQFEEIGKAWSLLRRITYPWADRVVVQTRGAASRFPWLRRPPAIVPNPVAAPLERAFTDPPGPPRIVAMGRLARQKGFDLLLRAVARLPDRHARAEVVLAGEGPEEPALRRLAGALGLAERVRFPGNVGNPATLHRSATVFVLSSRYEGFPNVLLEAMAEGVACIATDCPSGPGEIVEDDRNGLLVPPEDPAALTAAIERLLDDPALRSRLGLEGRKVRERYSIEVTVERWDEVLREARSGSLPERRP
jgi:glycosyltransferase involved in cell wall biosynthesis